MKIFAGLLVALSNLAGACLAQGLTAQLSQQESSFQGAYAGIGVGVATANGMTDYPVLSGGTRYAPYNPTNGNAFSGFAGYNFVQGNLVYGAEVQLTNLTGLSQIGTAENREVMDLADIRARLGHRFDKWMIYGALGWSWARFRVHPGSGFVDRPNQTTLQGPSLGLGVEYNLNEQWFLGGEVTYRDLNGRFVEASRDTDMDLNSLSLRLAYRF